VSQQLSDQVKLPANLTAIKSADVITISIGGNDILAAGADSGFTVIDEATLPERIQTLETNLSSTLAYIRQNNTKAKIILMNFFNLYHPMEMSGETVPQKLYDIVDKYLKPNSGYSNLGDYFLGLKDTYNLAIADSYSLFDQVNKGAAASSIDTGDTLASRPGFSNPPYSDTTLSGGVFPARFVPIPSLTAILSPYTAWTDYNTAWEILKSLAYKITSIQTVPDGVTFDQYTQYYNPNNYVFGYDEASSEIVALVKSKCTSFTWSLIREQLLASVGKFEKWRDVHCTALGHSLIAKAHINAWNSLKTVP
jgi:hypothetical protein